MPNPNPNPNQARVQPRLLLVEGQWLGQQRLGSLLDLSGLHLAHLLGRRSDHADLGARVREHLAGSSK